MNPSFIRCIGCFPPSISITDRRFPRYASKADLNAGLREGGRSGADSVRGQLARRLLVVGELALALALLVGAGLLIRSFDRLVQVSPGFVSDHLLTFVVSPPRAKYPKDEDLVRFYDDVITRMAAVGGVQSVGATDTLPFSGDWSTTSFTVEGYQPPKGQPSPWGDVRAVTPASTRQWASDCCVAGS